MYSGPHGFHDTVDTVDLNGVQLSANGSIYQPQYGNWGIPSTNSYDKYKFGNQAWQVGTWHAGGEFILDMLWSVGYIYVAHLVSGSMAIVPVVL